MWTEIKICVYYRLRLQSSSCGRSLNVIKRCEFLFLAAGASTGKKYLPRRGSKPVSTVLPKTVRLLKNG